MDPGRMVNSSTLVHIKYRSRWWNDLSKVSISNQGSRWFKSNLVWQVGSEKKFKFWKNEWLTNSQLKEKYPRIYNNSLLKDSPIGCFRRWSNERWEWDFCWRREWFEWEKPMVEEFMSSLSQVSLLPENEDLWLWNDPPSYSFSVKSAYEKLANHEIEGKN